MIIDANNLTSLINDVKYIEKIILESISLHMGKNL